MVGKEFKYFLEPCELTLTLSPSDALQNDSTPPVETAFQESASHVNYLSPDKNCDDVSSQNGEWEGVCVYTVFP